MIQQNHEYTFPAHQASTRVILVLAILLAVSTVARGDVAIFTTTADLCMGSTVPYRYNNEGAEYWFPIGDWAGMDQRTIMRFDVRSLGGTPDLRVDSIVLKLFSAGINASPHQSAVDNVTPVHPEIRAIKAANRDWVEGPGTGYDFVPNETCYVAKKTGATVGSVVAPWAGSAGLNTLGVDYDPEVLATRSLLRSDIETEGAEIAFPFSGNSAQLTDLINSWLLDNYTLSRDNPGILITDTSVTRGDRRRANFFSLQATNPPWPNVPSYPAAYRPQLVVSYSHVPEPGTIALLATGLIGVFVWVGRKRRR